MRRPREASPDASCGSDEREPSRESAERVGGDEAVEHQDLLLRTVEQAPQWPWRTWSGEGGRGQRWGCGEGQGRDKVRWPWRTMSTHERIEGSLEVKGAAIDASRAPTIGEAPSPPSSSSRPSMLQHRVGEEGGAR